MMSKRARQIAEKTVRGYAIKFRGIKADYSNMDPEDYPTDVTAELNALLEKMKKIREAITRDQEERYPQAQLVIDGADDEQDD